jgi:hypothetical protein
MKVREQARTCHFQDSGELLRCCNIVFPDREIGYPKAAIFDYTLLLHVWPQ